MKSRCSVLQIFRCFQSDGSGADLREELDDDDYERDFTTTPRVWETQRAGSTPKQQQQQDTRINPVDLLWDEQN
jgi:hypothetical protein